MRISQIGSSILYERDDREADREAAERKALPISHSPEAVGAVEVTTHSPERQHFKPSDNPRSPFLQTILPVVEAVGAVGRPIKTVTHSVPREDLGADVLF